MTSVADNDDDEELAEIGRYEREHGEELRRDLEAELRGREGVEGHAWYHGNLPRDHAEVVMRGEGGFLVRCVQPGEWILSIRSGGANFHLRIIRFIERRSESYSTIKFRLAPDDDAATDDVSTPVTSFDSIPSLITHHVGGVPIVAGGHVISIRHPINRKLPLSFTQHKFASLRRRQNSSQQHRSHHHAVAPQSHLPPKPSRSSVEQHQRSSETPSGYEVYDTPTRRPTNSATSRISTSTTITTRQNNNSNNSNNNNKKAKRISQFDPLYFKSQLLTSDNKPMDEAAINKTIEILLETDPFKLARHLTLMDCKICRVLEDGLEEIFLQKGQQLRKDLLERFQSTAFWVVTCVVRGGVTLDQRIKILNVFIQVANELVHSLGNLFGFSAIMHGLTSPHLSEMEPLWAKLKETYTNNAVTMEKKLRPLVRLLDDGEGQIAYKSTCIPHIAPYLRYYENPLDHVPHNNHSSEGVQEQWFLNLPNDSFDALQSNLESATRIVRNAGLIRGNLIAKLKDFVANNRVMEIFKTDFHLRILFGSTAFELPPDERYRKIDMIISIFARRPLES